MQVHTGGGYFVGAWLMPSFPYFRFFAGDWISDPNISMLSLEAQGCFVKLLCLMWFSKHTRVPSDRTLVSRMLSIDPRKWDRLRRELVEGPWAVLEEQGDSLVSPRLELEAQKVDMEEKKEDRKVSQALRYSRLCAARERGTHTTAEWTEMLRLCGGHCARCREGKPVRDHVIPVTDEASTDGIENLQPLCRSCNQTKGTRCTDFRPKVAIDFLEKSERDRGRLRLEEIRNHLDYRWNAPNKSQVPVVSESEPEPKPESEKKTTAVPRVPRETPLSTSWPWERFDAEVWEKILPFWPKVRLGDSIRAHDELKKNRRLRDRDPPTIVQTLRNIHSSLEKDGIPIQRRPRIWSIFANESDWWENHLPEVVEATNKLQQAVCEAEGCTDPRTIERYCEPHYIEAT